MTSAGWDAGFAPWALLVLVGACAACGRASKGPPQHYDDPQAMIDVFENEERNEWQLPDRVVGALPIPSKNAVIADIGAGSGYFTRRLALQVPEGRVYAVDVDDEFESYLLTHREAWGTPNIEPMLAHYDDPALPVGGIDLVFTANTYAYIRGRVDYFRKVRDALKPEGILAVLDFRPDASIGGGVAPAPEHRVSEPAATEELRQSGFTLERSEAFLPHQWFLILRREPSNAPSP